MVLDSILSRVTDSLLDSYRKVHPKGPSVDSFEQLLAISGLEESTEEIMHLLSSYAREFIDIELIEYSLSQISKDIHYTGGDADIIYCAWKNQEELLTAVMESLPGSTLEKQYQSLFVLTENRRNDQENRNPYEFVLSACDLEKKAFSKPVTETAFIRTMDQVIASLIKFSLTGDINIFALAPMTFATGLPNVSISTKHNGKEYIHIYFLLDLSLSRQKELALFKQKSLELYNALHSNDSHLSLHYYGDVCELRMRKDEIIKSPNYDKKKGRLPIANYAINIPLKNRVVIQTGIKNVSTGFHNPSQIEDILRTLHNKSLPRSLDILDDELELLTSNELFLPEATVQKVVSRFSTSIRNELNNLYFEIHLWYQYFLRFLMREDPLSQEKRAGLNKLIQEETSTYKDVTKLLFYDLYLLAKQQNALVKKMEQFSELLEQYERTNSLGQRKAFNIEKALEQAIHGTPPMVISTRYVPQTITIKLTNKIKGSKQKEALQVIGLELFPELLHTTFVMNAAKYNPTMPDIEISITVSLVTVRALKNKMYIKVTYENTGQMYSQTVIEQLFNPAIERILTLESTGKGISLKNALFLTLIQNNVEFDKANHVFCVENTNHGTRAWYILPLPTRLQKKLSKKE